MRLLSYLLLLSVLFVTCKKTDSSQPTTPPTPLTPSGSGQTDKQVKGKVILPTGSTINLASVKIINQTAEVPVTNGEFSIDTSHFHHSFHIVYAGGRILLMKYNYSGQTDNDITPRTSAIAMMMANLTMLSVNSVNRASLINTITASGSFDSLLTQVTQAIVIGRSLADTTNLQMIHALKNVYRYSSSLRLMDDPISKNPIKIERQNKLVSFTNSAACIYRIGVYRNGTYLEEFELDAMQYWPNSAKEALSGAFGNGYSNPVTKVYTLPSDGTYTFKITNGNPFKSNLTTESRNAQGANLSKFIADKISFYVPDLLENTVNCYGALLLRLNSIVSAYGDISTNSSGDVETLSRIVGSISTNVFNTYSDLVTSCPGGKDLSKGNLYFNVAKDFLKFLDVAGKTGEALNISTHLVHWANARTHYDTCLQVMGNTVNPCDLSVSLSVSGKVATAYVTGGTAPYTYKWANGGTFLNTDYQPADSWTLRNNGLYFVSVKDATGKTIESERKLIDNVSITNVKIERTGNFYVTLTIEWTSNLGLVPEGIGFIGAGNAANLRAIVTQTDIPDEPVNTNCSTSPIVYSIIGGPPVVTLTSTGGRYQINLSNNPPLQTGSFGFRLLDNVHGTQFCPSTSPYYTSKWGGERVVSWQ